MSTALITTLRESCSYLHDDGYHQTARLIAAAADEIERLNRRVYALEARDRRVAPRWQASMSEASPPDHAGADPRRHHGR
jgi:hypothetical protein